jgi:hypothetical protein
MPGHACPMPIGPPHINGFSLFRQHFILQNKKQYEKDGLIIIACLDTKNAE